MENNSGTKEKLQMEDASADLKRSKHKPWFVALIAANVVWFLIVMTFNYLSSSPVGNSSGIFLNNTGDVSDRYYVEITPAGWTFSIWGFIYTWQIIWLAYAVASIFRKTSNGDYMYLNPLVHPPVFYMIYFINLCVNMSWIFLFDRQLIGWSLPFAALMAFTLYLMLIISLRRLFQNGGYMLELGIKKDIWMIRFFVQNGLAFYATWVTIATLLNFAIMLTYRCDINQSTASTLALAFVAVEVTSWSILDMFVFEKYTRYLFSPYIVVNFALTGSIAKNYQDQATNSVISLMLISISGFVFIAKIVLLFVRHKTRPLFSNAVENIKNQSETVAGINFIQHDA